MHDERDPTETIEDVVDNAVFKYKYRIADDDLDTFGRREARTIDRSLKRAETRDP